MNGQKDYSRKHIHIILITNYVISEAETEQKGYTQQGYMFISENKVQF